MLKWSDAIINDSQLAVHKHYQTDWLQILAEGFIRFVQLFLRICEAHRVMTLWEPLLSLLSFCHVSVSLHLCPVSRPAFYFFPSLFFQGCAQWPSSAWDAPAQLLFLSSPFSLSGFSLSLSLSALPPSVSVFNFFFLALFLHPTPYQETKREAILMRAQYFLFPLNRRILI